MPSGRARHQRVVRFFRLSSFERRESFVRMHWTMAFKFQADAFVRTYSFALNFRSSCSCSRSLVCMPSIVFLPDFVAQRSLLADEQKEEQNGEEMATGAMLAIFTAI